ncbi:MAG: PhzF family phenazine biosynthesis protein [Sphingomicrobium sp.]
MTSLPFFQVDAFAADAPLTGNPAAVMPLDRWLDDATMQAIAAENNLSETAFTVPSARADADYDLRWFTPTTEVDLCGHASLATGHILVTGQPLRFATRSGILTVTRADDLVELDVPAFAVAPGELSGLHEALGVSGPTFVHDGGSASVIVLLDDEAAVRAVRPDFTKLRVFDRLVIVTAPGDTHAIASRVFAAYHGIDEDPVTGAAHAALVPFWAERLGRESFSAVQASKRSGLLHCRLTGDRVILGGRCQTVIVGQFQL